MSSPHHLVPDTVPADVHVDSALVHRLIARQHPDLLAPIVRLAEGYDNVIFRVGEHWLARMPRRRMGAETLDREALVLPTVAPLLAGLDLPWPRRAGVPDGDYPYRWALVPYRAGACPDPSASTPARADQLTRIFAALHVPCGADAPTEAARAIPLLRRDAELRRNLHDLATLHGERSHLLALWEAACRAPPWGRPPVWVHGDLHPMNLLARDGVLTGVLDWGDAFGGDPAPDLSAVWMLLDPAHHGPLRAAYDPATWQRGLGWTVWLRVMLERAVVSGAPSFLPITTALRRRLG